MSEADFISGYDIHRYGEIDNTMLAQTEMPPSFAAPASIPEEIDPRGPLKEEDQLRRPSCTGNGLTTVGETISGLKCGDWSRMIQFSRLFSWLNGQKHWMGKINPNEGCTIQHVIEAAMEDGLPPEDVVPYSLPADSRALRPEFYEAAKAFRIQGQTGLRSYDDDLRFLQGGFGAILLGIEWTTGLANCRGRITRGNMGGRAMGGHAVAIVGYRKGGIPLLANSHGTAWGQGGYAEVDPEAMDYWHSRSYTVMRGLTDMTSFDRVRVLPGFRGVG